MNLDDLIGLQLAVGFHGTKPTGALIQQLKQTRARSLVVFARNFVSPRQFKQLICGLEQGLGYRLFIMVDHEGGRVIRFKKGVTQFPAALAMSHRPASVVKRQGTTEARQLKSLGVSVNLAPCVDVLVKGCDPIIGDRSYGFDPKKVSSLALARIAGLQSNQVAACAKHFPGLGSVPRDPHKVLPTIKLGWPVMKRVHLAPFKTAIEAQVATVMSSHVCYPALKDPAGLPATFSPRLIAGLLRKQLKFNGVILTDDLEMGALRSFGSIGEAAVRAAEAGHDMFLVCSDLNAAQEALIRLRQAYEAGRLALKALEMSAFRINKLRQKYLCPPLS